MTKTALFYILQGDHVTEVHQVFNESVSQVIRIFDSADYIEFEWLVGPIEFRYRDCFQNSLKKHNTKLVSHFLII